MGKKYNIIYADPPWKFQTYSERGSLPERCSHISVMFLILEIREGESRD